MRTTYINSENAVYYVTILPDELAYSASVLIGVEDDEGTACGVLAAGEQKYGKTQEKIINLLYIYVHPDYRGLGAATEMLALLDEYGLKNGFTGIQAQYLASNETMNLWRFLNHNGFESDEEPSEYMYRLPFRAWEKMIVAAKIKVPDKLVWLKDFDSSQKQSFANYVKDGKRLPLEAYNKNLSLCAFDESNKLKAGALTVDCHNGDIDLREIFHIGENTKLFGKVIGELLEKIKTERGEEIYIRFIPVVDDKLLTALDVEGVEKSELLYQLKVF